MFFYLRFQRITLGVFTIPVLGPAILSEYPLVMPPDLLLASAAHALRPIRMPGDCFAGREEFHKAAQNSADPFGVLYSVVYLEHYIFPFIGCAPGAYAAPVFRAMRTARGRTCIPMRIPGRPDRWGGVSLRWRPV